MKEILLKNTGNVSYVDDEDYEWLSKMAWRETWNGYAVTNIKMPDGRKLPRRMHRLIMNTPKGLDTDHIDGNRLNNVKSNLRICTRSENLCNSKKRSNCSSKYKGVSYHKKYKKWETYIDRHGKRTKVGYFDTEIEAALAYNEAAKELHGEYAKLNEVPNETNDTRQAANI